MNGLNLSYIRQQVEELTLSLGGHGRFYEGCGFLFYLEGLVKAVVWEEVEGPPR